MSAHLIDGNGLHSKLMQEIQQDLARHQTVSGGVPGLAVIRVGYDAASSVYIRRKKLAAQTLRFDYREHLLAESAPQDEVIDLIHQLNRDPKVHGILPHLPLPAHLSPMAVIGAIEPSKDVDGLHPLNAGLLIQRQPGVRPCTPLAVMRLLEEIDFDPAGKRAVIIGRSTCVGKPLAMLLLAAHATVTVCHRHSDLPAALKHADLVVSAIGSARQIKGAWIKRGAVVIDIGINRVDGALVGDVEFETAAERASFITPVPGGVGAVTVAMLMHNTWMAWVEASRRQSSASRGVQDKQRRTLEAGALTEPAFGLAGLSA
ncbi:bifunctional 5,10-methylenetetrahydrofolate dehydrogenase/5,10-methenyltetrahydrofolate cyclohydrolase [Methyloterricola oryzae]|uniref:bifunctional 5,10-methylenetetrahydrofolate dehydrogenase/5,10-methenyltetrahydrofolate cyclohydrolase n=1 Tax=Methyloterricola oryzae TaxID=1495050 RepID=UPI0009E5E396|nr:bifunctional 5,10-methylenetetrahydrofolate dehydrogenase/5,10-methenyltetrahydrofolate cyclohydrolase [Methyloterricola oryzae]